MLRLTTTVVQVLTDAHVIVSVCQESEHDGPSQVLGEARTVYDMGTLMDRYDEVTALAVVLGWWADDVSKSTK